MTQYQLIPFELKGAAGSTALRLTQVLNKDILPSVLRNRTTLAYLHYKKLLASAQFVEGYRIWAYAGTATRELEEWKHIFATEMVGGFAHPLGKPGGLLALRDPIAPMHMQCPAFILRDDLHPSDLEDALSASMRWLNDRPSVLRTLQSIWPERTMVDG